MNDDMRCSIKKLKKLARLKEYLPIKDKIYAVVYYKKNGHSARLRINYITVKAG